MGVGFIITIILLAALLGIFSRQVLSTQEEQSYAGSDPNGHDDHNDTHHSHAM